MTWSQPIWWHEIHTPPSLRTHRGENDDEGWTSATYVLTYGTATNTEVGHTDGTDPAEPARQRPQQGGPVLRTGGGRGHRRGDRGPRTRARERRQPRSPEDHGGATRRQDGQVGRPAVLRHGEDDHRPRPSLPPRHRRWCRRGLGPAGRRRSV